MEKKYEKGPNNMGFLLPILTVTQAARGFTANCTKTANIKKGI